MSNYLETIKCQWCSKKFTDHKCKQRLFCSKSCAKKGFTPLINVRGGHSGINHKLWKGNRVGYRALHAWVQRQLGSPAKCEFCGLSEAPKGKTKYFHWANKSKNYLRDINDWLRLCAECHKNYDLHGIGEYSHF